VSGLYAATYDDSAKVTPYATTIVDGDIINMTGYHQSKDWTCGCACIRMIEGYYFNNVPKEDTVVNVTGATSLGGTSLVGVRNYFNASRWKLVVKENASMAEVMSLIDAGIPVMVGWVDWGGHWAIPVGYDLKAQGTGYWNDDTLIFRDPYDQVDGAVDCYTTMSMWRFNSMWEENHYITPGRTNVHLLVIPIPLNPQKNVNVATEALKTYK
jgi:hypothetical protein